ncbi:hypothetical protein EDD18DRAFT_328934 [Armillaria luteobubalina]|uniref:F-box domain-containing protein n=1 Tax=Armillaria luteobubalina TaxID=153913 RepID=A0AA39V4G0_9AGAR|nr:hypothetical protein EDD18DRAFT_328934 [Armillaria luteobubalina]
MAESLPRELVDAIIDELPSRRDLKALSLTCHVFSLPARAILFRQIKLTQLQLNPDVVQRFHELCVVSPHIPPLVRALHLDGRCRGPTFLAVFDIISWVLQFMQNLRVIKLYHVTIGNWVPSTTSSHSLREIHLTDVIFHEDGFRQMCALIRGSPHLERLFVHDNRRFSAFGGNATSQLSLNHTHCGPRIKDLSLGNRPLSSFIEAILDTKNCLVSIEELRWFQYTLTTATDFQHLAKILELTSGTLRVLLLTLSLRRRTLFLNELPLIRIGDLRQIAFITMTRVYGHQYLRWWIQSLRKVSQSNRPPALQVMDIQLDTLYHWDPVLPEWPWCELDEILSSPPFDTRFRMLTIKVCKGRTFEMTPGEGASRHGLWVQFEAQFPRLAGKLRVSIQEY